MSDVFIAKRWNEVDEEGRVSALRPGLGGGPGRTLAAARRCRRFVVRADFARCQRARACACRLSGQAAGDQFLGNLVSAVREGNARAGWAAKKISVGAVSGPGH